MAVGIFVGKILNVRVVENGAHLCGVLVVAEERSNYRFRYPSACSRLRVERGCDRDGAPLRRSGRKTGTRGVPD